MIADLNEAAEPIFQNVEHPVINACIQTLEDKLESGLLTRMGRNEFTDRIVQDAKQVLFVAGPKRHGKDSFAQAVQEQVQRDVSIVPFAQEIKNVVLETTNCDPAWLYGTEEERELPRDLFASDGFDALSGRQVCQLFGTDAAQPRFGPDIWTDVWRGNAVNGSSQLVIAPDTRFEHEALIANDIRQAYAFAEHPTSAAVIRIFNGNRMNELNEGHCHATEAPLPPSLIDIERTCYSLGDVSDYANEVCVRLNLPT